MPPWVRNARPPRAGRSWAEGIVPMQVPPSLMTTISPSRLIGRSNVRAAVVPSSTASVPGIYDDLGKEGLFAFRLKVPKVARPRRQRDRVKSLQLMYVPCCDA